MNKSYSPEKAVLDDEEIWYEDHLDEFVPGTKENSGAQKGAAKKPPKTISEKKQMVSNRVDPKDLLSIKK